MSVFVPPSPTGAVAAVDGTDNNLSSNNPNTDPFVQSPDGTTADGTTTNPGSNNNNSNSPQSNSAGGGGGGGDLPLPTKIGIGVGVGGGTVVLVVAITFLLWKRRMGHNSHNHGHGRDSDSEMGGRTPQEKAKLDWESEHDVAFDFGGFFRERNAGRNNSIGKKENNNLGLVDGVPPPQQPQAFVEMPLSYSRQQQEQVAVAELDGGGGGYRGVVGLGR
jgi:hypothetical protein